MPKLFLFKLHHKALDNFALGILSLSLHFKPKVLFLTLNPTYF